MKLALFFLPLLPALLIGFTCATKRPGLITAVTTKGLQYACVTGVPILQQELLNLNIPDISDSYSAAIVGKLDYTLTKVKLQGLNIPNIVCTFGSKGVTVNSTGISFSGTAQWQYRKRKWPHISDSGRCNLTLTGISLSVSILLGKDSNGHATLNTTGCSISVGQMSVDFTGGTSWLYNLFDRSISGSLKKSLNKELCKELTKFIISEGNKTIDSFPVMLPVGKVAEIDYALTGDPVFTTGYVELPLKGEFLSISNPQEAPIYPPRLPPVSVGNRMGYVWLTGYLANTASFAFWSAGMLNYTITRDLVHKVLKTDFTTLLFKDTLPQFYNEFPDMDMKLIVNATKPPNLRIVPDSADVTITGTVDVFVIEPNKTEVPAFVLGLTLYADVNIFINSSGSQPMVVANATLIRTDLKLVSSEIGRFNVTDLQNYINFLSTFFIVPALNYYGNIGIAIPVIKNVTFLKPVLTLHQDYALVETDISYHG